jgi:hypothetical protein
MGKIVISENVTLDGFVKDPTGAEGFPESWLGQIGDKDRESGPRSIWPRRRCRGPATGSSDRRVLRGALSQPAVASGRTDRQHAQVRRVLHPRNT